MRIFFNNICGDDEMNKLAIYIHGKGGSAAEAEHYKPLFSGYDVIGLDYKSQTPWDAKKEFPVLFDTVTKGYDSIIIIANSIGAYFTMSTLQDKKINRAFFISPIVNMEKLICDMMTWQGVSEADLQEKKEIKTSFGEVLSWEYLCYVRDNPVKWMISTDILYGGQDNLTSYETVSSFAKIHRATLTVMEYGEHWFHTDEQMDFLDKWMYGLVLEAH